MSKCRNHGSGGKQCMCDTCGASAVSISGKTHRRCSGLPDQPIVKKHCGIEPASKRGTWQ